MPQVSQSIIDNLNAAREAAKQTVATEPITPIAPVATTEPIVPEVPITGSIADSIPPVENTPAPSTPVVEDPDAPKPIASDDMDFLNSLNDSGTPEITTSSNTAQAPSNEPASKVNFDDETINPYVSKAKEYEQLLSDPFFKAFAEFRKNGGEDIRAFSKNIAGADYDLMTPEQLYREDIKGLGITEEQIEDEMLRFEEMSPVEKLRLTNPIKIALKNKQEESVKAFSMPVNKNAELRSQAAQTAVPELKDTITNMVGKKYLALTITPEMGNEINNYVMNHTEEKFDTNGNFIGYDIKESVNTAVLKLYQKKLLKATAELAASNARDEAYRSRQRPSRMDEPAGNTPLPERNVSDAIKSLSDKKWR